MDEVNNAERPHNDQTDVREYDMVVQPAEASRDES